ncbi:MAG: hypothetical protein HY445_02995 [Candidatus Niyogibacteria bacterium]|nr:hypothetical protein [Candidatus Niyogibacteria bacterium]
MSSLARNILLGAILALFVGYLAFQLQGFIFGSHLEIFSPEQGAHFYTSHVSVSGKTEDISFLSLDGRTIFTDDNGLFEEELILPYGLNIIRIIGKGRFGRTYEEERMIYITGQ